MENGSDAPVKSTRIGQKKTAAKAAGLKSTFILDADYGELLMTPSAGVARPILKSASMAA